MVALLRLVITFSFLRSAGIEGLSDSGVRHDPLEDLGCQNELHQLPNVSQYGAAGSPRAASITSANHRWRSPTPAECELSVSGFDHSAAGVDERADGFRPRRDRPIGPSTVCSN